MDEDFLSWLLLVPGITRKQAELLAARFASVEALRAATVHDLVGIGLEEPLARRVLDFAETAAPGTDRLYRGDAGLYLCPECGALIARDAAKCPFCGTVFEAGEEEARPEPEVSAPGATPPDRLQAEGQALNLCPSCGAFVGRDVTACPSCGTVLEGEEEAAGEIPEEAEDRLEREGQGLFLCPECGALVGAGTTVCPRCGTSLEGEEEAPPAEAEKVAELPPEALTGGSSLFVCTNCGAFLRAEDTKCPSCGVEFEEGAIAEAAPAPEAETGAFFPICPNCGALVPSTARRCAICGHRMGEPVAEKAPPVEEEIGITKDFLERWRRIAEEKALTPEKKLLRELEQYDSILAADPTVERAWLKKASILVQLGRLKDAVACYESLASLNPAKDDAYRIEVLDFLKSPADMSFLPPRWSRIRATEPAREIAPRPP